MVTDTETENAKQVETFNGSEKMGFKEEHSYLEDIISNDGKQTKNVMSIKNKGIGIINQFFFENTILKL